MRCSDFRLRGSRTDAISGLETRKNRHVERNTDIAAIGRHATDLLPGRAGRHRNRRSTLRPSQINTSFSRLELRLGRLQIWPALPGLVDQAVNIALKCSFRRHTLILDQGNLPLGIKTQHIGQRTQRISRLALCLDAIQSRLRERRLCLQAVRWRCNPGLVAPFSNLKTFLCRALGLSGRDHRSPRRLSGIKGLQRRQEQRLDRRALAGSRGIQELLRVLDVGGTLTKIEHQPGKRQCGGVLVEIARIGEVSCCTHPAINIRQPGRLCNAHQCGLRPRGRPDFTGLRIVAKRQVDRIDRRQRHRWQVS